MSGKDLLDEIDCGSFFDQIGDFIDFPTYNIDTTSFNYDDFSTLWSEDSLLNDSILSGEENNAGDDGLMVQFSGYNRFNSPSPISVLESSSAATVTTGGTKTETKTGLVFPTGKTQKAPRSKRPRPVTFTPRPNLAGEDERPKKKRRLPSNHHNQLTIRKCNHCEITKTPQWRMGPMGPKTLCNACGVRYKSGRLFPEYRPAASPTFIPALHSNSHKKVIEMRSIATPTALEQT